MNRLSEQIGEMLNKEILDAVDAYQLNFPAPPKKGNAENEGIDTQKSQKENAEADFTDHRRKSRAMLIYLVTHHKYPALMNLTALKALIDDAVAVDGCELSENNGERDTRMKEARLWLSELLDAEKLLDAPMHFPPSYMAETLSLLAIHDPQSEELANLSRKFRWRAEQSFTLGRQHYQNLSRLVYLFDDFNDRRRHSVHAGQMAMADMLAFYRYILDRRKNDTQQEQSGSHGPDAANQSQE